MFTAEPIYHFASISKMHGAEEHATDKYSISVPYMEVYSDYSVLYTTVLFHTVMILCILCCTDGMEWDFLNVFPIYLRSYCFEKSINF